MRLAVLAYSFAGAAAVVILTLSAIELPQYLQQRAAARAEKARDEAVETVKRSYKTDSAVRLLYARIACQEAAKEQLNDPAPVFADVDDWPAKEESLDHFSVELRVRSRRSDSNGYVLLKANCHAAHDVRTDKWAMKLEWPNN